MLLQSESQLEKVYTNINEWIYLKEQALIKSYHIDISIKQINLTLSRDFKIEESYEVIKEDIFSIVINI